MNVTDIIRSVLDLIDSAQESPDDSTAAIEVDVAPENDQELEDIQKLAGILGIDGSDSYANEPNEIVSPVVAAFPAGDDVHYSKHPSDIRADSISMYPDWQARK